MIFSRDVFKFSPRWIMQHKNVGVLCENPFAFNQEISWELVERYCLWFELNILLNPLATSFGKSTFTNCTRKINNCADVKNDSRWGIKIYNFSKFATKSIHNTKGSRMETLFWFEQSLTIAQRNIWNWNFLPALNLCTKPCTAKHSEEQ